MLRYHRSLHIVLTRSGSMHESLAPTDSHFSKNQEKILLKNAVSSVGPLSAMEDQSDKHLLHSGKELTHDQYSNLLSSVVANYGTQFSSSSGQSSKKVHVTEADNYNFSRDSPSEVTEEFNHQSRELTHDQHSALVLSASTK